MAVDAVGALSQLALLDGVDRKHVERLARSFRERSFSAGEAVTTQGERGGFFFVILEGTADVSVNGEPRATLGPGDPFGEMALIDDGPRSATVTATSDLRCMTLTPWEFRPLVEDQPSVAWNLLQTMARRLRAVEAQ